MMVEGYRWPSVRVVVTRLLIKSIEVVATRFKAEVGAVWCSIGIPTEAIAKSRLRHIALRTAGSLTLVASYEGEHLVQTYYSHDVTDTRSSQHMATAVCLDVSDVRCSVQRQLPGLSQGLGRS